MQRKFNERAVVMREAIGKIVQMLSSKKIEVRLRGVGASVEYDPRTLQPKAVNLPSIPDDASDELIDAVQGFCDHEVAHILFTDVKVVAEAAKGGESLKNLHNGLEDTMIERKMRAQFTGSAYNLSNTGTFFCKKVLDPLVQKAISKGDTATTQALLLNAAIRSWAGQWEFSDYMKTRWGMLANVTAKIGNDLIEEIPTIADSAHALDLAKRIIKRLNDEDKSGSSGNSDDDKGKSGGKGKSKPTKGKPEKGEGKPEKGEGKPEKGEGEPKEGEEEGKPGEGKPGEGEGEGEGEGSSGAPNPSEDEDEGEGEGAASTGSEEDPTGSTEEYTPGGKKPRKDVRNESSDGVPTADQLLGKVGGIDEGVAQAIAQLAAYEAKDSEYLVFTTDDDQVASVEPSAGAHALLPGVQAAADAVTGPMQKDLERAIAARSAAVFVGGQKRGRLNGAQLHRVMAGRVDVFSRKQENKTKDVAVSVVCDFSGSMHGAKLQTAVESALAVASVLDRLSIKNEVVGFTTKSMSSDVRTAMRADPLAHQYSRSESIRIDVLKDFGEKLTPTRKAAFCEILETGSCQSNVDGESVLIAYRRLMKQRAARHVMIVFSDGRPAVSGGKGLGGHLKRVVEQIEATGVDVMGIGIQDDSVRSFYKKHAVIRSVSELPNTVMTSLKTALMR